MREKVLNAFMVLAGKCLFCSHLQRARCPLVSVSFKRGTTVLCSAWLPWLHGLILKWLTLPQVATDNCNTALKAGQYAIPDTNS